MAKTNADIMKMAIEKNPEFQIFSKEDERSIYNLVPPYVQQAIDDVPKEYLFMPEKEVYKRVKPDETTQMLRMQFWAEYQRAQFTNTKMQMSNVYSGIVEQCTFTNFITKDPDRMSWIMKPPVRWLAGMQVTLNQGLQVMMEAVYASNIIEDGKVNPKVLDSVMRVVDRAIVAIHGLPTLRTETKSMNVNINQSSPTPSFPEIESKKRHAEELRAKLEAPKDVTPVDDK